MWNPEIETKGGRFYVSYALIGKEKSGTGKVRDASHAWARTHCRRARLRRVRLGESRRESPRNPLDCVRSPNGCATQSAVRRRPKAIRQTIRQTLRSKNSVLVRSCYRTPGMM